MSITSNYTSLRDMYVAGVTNLTSPPTQINTATLPFKFVQLTSTEFEVTSLGNTYGLQTNVFEIVYLVEPLLQNTSSNNLTSYLGFIDLLYDAIDTIASVLKVVVEYRILNIGNTAYHSLIQKVTMID